MKQFCVKLVCPIRLSIIMRTDIYLILAPTLGVCQYVYKTLKTLQGGLFDLLGLSQLPWFPLRNAPAEGAGH